MEGKVLGERMREFALNPKIVEESLALLKVGMEKKETPESVMQHVIFNIIARWESFPLTPLGKN